jgi:hypothetical protein
VQPTSNESLVRFIGLLRDLQSGTPSRNSYAPWEVELLIDFDSCEFPPGQRRKLLDRYGRAARRRIERGDRPLKLSEYLARRFAARVS